MNIGGQKTTVNLASASADALDLSSCGTQSTTVESGDSVAAPFSDAPDHTRHDPLAGYVGRVEPDGDGLGRDATRTRSAVADLCGEIREHYRSRQDFLNAEKRLTLQTRAICRRLVGGDVPESHKLYKAIIGKGDHPVKILGIGATAPLLAARQHVSAERKAREAILTKIVKELPVYQFVEDVPGFAALGLAMIIGEAGPLDNYSNPAKLWKRMGLAVINGGRQRRVAGAESIEHGYCPERRAVMFVIGDSMMKKQNRYRALRDERKLIEREKAAAEGKTVAPAAKIPKEKAEQFMSEGHILNRANRYIQKRLLRDLWSYWRSKDDVKCPVR